ncbi:OB-fold domain-containing protein [Rhodococcus sp. T2V]|uniref:Zn-ribbon domain-containing OB-fold protein n=1 Tax=Rhodococcus sp. T2V TaxID=3034164 RepID=UPI0023E0FA12|nr:OB-fold domain-containing protein [Rhodococcus sp. T2V]MDF3312192.1 OB-fold domain-containing protein [Rhodococcus sp. T2V]
MPVLRLERDHASSPFFDATARGVLLLKRCADCHHWSAPEVTACPRCGSTSLKWQESKGSGVVASWAVIHPKPGQGMPLPVCIVELDEGPWMRGQLRVENLESIHTRMKVITQFDAADGGEWIPVFVSLM